MQNLPTIPLYHVDHLIAEGGTARVYWGIDLRSGYPVAIKELKSRHLRNKDIRDKFRTMEAQLYLHIQHPNIPRLIDFVELEHTGQLFIIMEFIEGQNLENYIYNDIGLIPEHKALPMFLEILNTVGYLHRFNVLHLDIKSNNIILQPNGNIKLLDMGIASKISDLSNSTGFGTPAYMPPEQSERGVCGRYTDVFALGVMLFEMLTGSVPFYSNETNQRAAIEEIRHKIKHDPTPMLTDYYPFIHKGLQDIIEKALAKNTADRYQSCDEFAAAITSHMYSTL